MWQAATGKSGEDMKRACYFWIDYFNTSSASSCCPRLMIEGPGSSRGYAFFTSEKLASVTC